MSEVKLSWRRSAALCPIKLKSTLPIEVCFFNDGNEFVGEYRKRSSRVICPPKFRQNVLNDMRMSDVL